MKHKIIICNNLSHLRIDSLIKITLIVHSTVMFGQFNTEDYGRDEEEQTIADREPETILKKVNKQEI